MRCLLYYITDRKQFRGDEDSRCQRLLEKISEAARCRVDFIQLREKDLSGRELEFLGHQALHTIRLESGNQRPETRLLINSRTDVALAIGADGVHFPTGDISPQIVRTIWTKSGARAVAGGIVSLSCHSEEDVRRAASEQADLAVFAPVFEKRDAPHVQPVGLEALRRACQHKVPVLALGGVTVENARSCLDAGAAGIAGIRLFQDNDMRTVVEALRYP